MRWLVLGLLAGCSFTPGVLGEGALPDASTDAPDPIQVRRIDIVDAQVVGTHADFPLLVSLTEPWLATVAKGGSVQRPDGFDIYFSHDQAGAMRLAHEVELYDSSGRLVAWVKVPTLDAQTSLYLHYGDAAITADLSQPQQVWTGYELVIHGTGMGDATGKATSVPGAGSLSVPGFIGSAGEYDGATSHTDAQSGTAIDDLFASGGTVEAWIKPDSMGGGSFGRIFDKTEWGVLLDNSNVAEGVSFYHGTLLYDYVGQWHAPTVTNLFGHWHHVAFTYDKRDAANVPAAVIDGASVAVTEDNATTGDLSSDSLHNLVIGNRITQDRGFDGVIDEIRASSVVRSDGWLATQFQNHSDPAAFYTVSPPL